MTRLSGQVVVVTRDGDPDDRLVGLLEREGARVVVWPTLGVAPPLDAGPLERAAAGIREYDWVAFTSVRAVRALSDLVREPPPGVSAAAVGAATATAAEQAGWNVRATGPAGAALLAQELIDAGDVRGASVLFPAASLAGEALERTLAQAGAKVDRVEAYRTLERPPQPDVVSEDLSSGVDFVTFASPSAARALAESLGGSLSGLAGEVAIVAIGASTEEALHALGVEHVIVAPRPSMEGLVEACVSSPLRTK